MASIKCGCCKAKHGSVQEVRECYDYRDAVENEFDADAAYERWLEDGGPHAAQIRWEHEMDERRAYAW